MSVLITGEYLSYMKYRRTVRGNTMPLDKTYCHSHLATDIRTESALICHCRATALWFALDIECTRYVRLNILYRKCQV
jgi:hypothetical protein